MRKIVGLSIDEMALEYRKLRENLKRLEESGNGEIGEPIRDRITELTKGIAMATAQNTGELALKAFVALDWLDSCDVPGMVCASLCRDVVLMFPKDS